MQGSYNTGLKDNKHLNFTDCSISAVEQYVKEEADCYPATAVKVCRLPLIIILNALLEEEIMFLEIKLLS